MVKQIIVSAGVRGISSAATLLLNLLVSLLYPAEVYGAFVVFSSSVIFFSAICRFGMDKVCIRSIPSMQNENHIIVFINAVIAFLLLWFLVVSVFYLVLHQFSLDIFLMCSIFMALNYVIADVVRARGFINIGMILSGVVSPIILCFFAILFFDEFKVDYKDLFFLSLVLSIIFSLGFLKFMACPFLKYDFSGFIAFDKVKDGFFVMLHVLSVVGMQTLPIMIGSMFFSNYDMGKFHYGVLVSMIVGFIPLVLTAVFEPRLARNHRDAGQLQKIITVMNKYSVLLWFICLLMTFICVFIMSLYEVSYFLESVVVLVAGQTVNLISSRYQIFIISIGEVKHALYASSLALILTCSIIFLFSSYGLIVMAIAIFSGFLCKFLVLKFCLNKQKKHLIGLF